MYRQSRCSSGTQPSTRETETLYCILQCVSCLGISDQESMLLFKFMTLREHVVNPKGSLIFHCDKAKGNILYYMDTYISSICWVPQYNVLSLAFSDSP